MEPLKVLIADDNREFVDVLYEFISMQPDMEVCGVAYNGKDAVELVKSRQTHVVILDTDMNEWCQVPPRSHDASRRVWVS